MERRLSVANRSLASRSSLRASRGSDNAPVSRAYLLRRLRRYQRLYRQPVPPDVAWCRPYVSLMGELVQELRARS